MEPIRRFPTEHYAAALESWSFLELSDKRPLFTSPFGDVFFESRDGFWFLDLLAGEISRRWEAESDFTRSLNSREGQAEVYSFRVPPALGGAVDLENVELSDFVVATNIAGQIHQQIKDLPPGTPISGLSLK
jgi:hypothetical protein